jgi:hypothetical protein
MRLSDSQPPDAKERWNEELRKPDVQTLSLAYRLGRIAPPGIVERLMASCYGFGRYHRFWRRGALISAPVPVGSQSQLLIELKARPNADGTTSAKMDHELAIELRGAKSARAELWAVMLQVRQLSDTVLNDFPGLPLSCELTCPGCLASTEHRDLPTKWPADETMSRPLKCELCGELVSLQLVTADQVPAPKPLSLSLHLSDEDASKGAGAVQNESKFVAEKLRYGKPIESAERLHKLLGITDEKLATLLAAGESAISDEIILHAATATDEYGWTDVDWLNYCKDERANENKPPIKLKGEFAQAALEGHWGHVIGTRTSDRASEGFECGHQGMKLDDFVALPIAVSAGLKRSHVLALRLYSSSMFRSINKPLHDGCSVERPHPYPALVANLDDACRKLRSCTSEREKMDGKTFLWRGVRNLDAAASEFKQRGSTEVAVFSTSRERQVAQEYTVRGATRTKASLLLLKLKIETAEHLGANVAPFSIFPHEIECIFPPCTYLEARGDSEETIRLPSGEEATLKVIEVVPHVNDHN